MRLLVGALILILLFSGAALWQRSWKEESRSDRRAAAEGSAASSDGWSRVVVGRPGGGERYEAREEARTAPQETPRAPAADAVAVVQAGQTLSEICRARYGSAGRELVGAVARYNRLAGPDDLREGQTILLPSAEKLEAPR